MLPQALVQARLVGEDRLVEGHKSEEVIRSWMNPLVTTYSQFIVSGSNARPATYSAASGAGEKCHGDADPHVNPPGIVAPMR